MTVRFFTSDHHFYHHNILKYEADHRPFSRVDEMNEALIERWNARVGVGDEVVYVGDFAFGRDATPERVRAILGRLNGRKSLVRGNHDPRPERCLELGFERVDAERTLTLEGARGERVEARVCHYPFADSEEEVARGRPTPDGRWLVHGHVHGLWRVRPERLMVNVSVEVWGLAPAAELELVELMTASV